MLKTRKIVTCLLLVFLLTSAFFGGCEGKNGQAKVVLTTGFGKDDVFILGEKICTLPEIMVYLTNVQSQYENVYGLEIWNASLDGVSLEVNVKDTVLARIAQVKTMSLMADDRGIELDERERGYVEDAAESYYASLNATEIEKLQITKELLVQMYTEYALSEKLYKALIADINPEISDDEARFVKVYHIFFATTTKDGAGNIVPYATKDKSASYRNACKVRAMALKEDQDFKELALQYSEDDQIELAFGKGQLDSVIEDAAFDMETGEISKVLETETGYHLLKCISTLDREETDANKIAIVEKRRAETFEAEYNEYLSSLVRNLNEELWDQITLVHDEEITTSSFFAEYENRFH